GLHALLDRPELARPARRQAAARHDLQSLVTRRAPRGVSSAVATVVVDHDPRPPAAIVLREQRCDARSDAVRFVACRHDGCDGRPCGKLGWGASTLFTAPPKA